MVKKKNENYSPVVSAGTRSPKAFLLISVIAALCADVCVSALLIWSGVPVLYWIFPVLSMAADALFLLGAVFTNFRFKYSLGELCSFVVFVCAVVVAENLVNFTGETVSLSTVAAVMWTASHVLSIACVVATAVHASKRIKGSKIAKVIVATLFCLLAAVCAVFYGLFVLGGGFFGQGGYELRTPEYVYDENTDSYEVKGVMQGRGGIVVIPETFNDKKVSAVSFNVFNAEGVTDVHLNSADVKFTDEDELSHFGGDVNIYVDKEDADALRKSFYEMRKISYRAFDLANCVEPVVDADEVFISFAYDATSFATANGKTLPIWIGKKGETFNLSAYAQEFPYVKYNTASNEAGLYVSYSSFGGKVLKEIKYFAMESENINTTVENADGDTPLDGAKISRNVWARIKFENVYRIKVQDDNDLKYEPAASFKSLESTGYRFATSKSFDRVLSELNSSRKGFTLSYKYGITETMTAQTYHGFSDIASVNFEENIVYMYPEWELNAPKINKITTNANGGNIIYGENLEVTADITSPADEIQLSYAWTRQTEASTENVASAADFTIEKIKREQGGRFSLSVEAYGDNTSLTSNAGGSVDVNVLTRPVYLDWTGTEAVTYDGQTHDISFKVRERQTGSGILESDGVSVHIYSQNSFPVDITTNTASYKNAGTYTVGGRLSNGAAASNYYIVSSTESVQKVINKAPLDIEWSETTQFVYNKTAQAPAIKTITGGVSGEDTKVTVSGAQVHSNNYSGQSYTAMAVTSNNNYYIRNVTCGFTIAQREVEVVWGNTSLTYTGERQAPGVSLSSSGNNVIEGDDIGLDRTGGWIFANDYTGISEYTATATFSNLDYKATAATATKTFKILPKPVSFVWDTTTSFEYNGAVQYPKVNDITGAYPVDLNSLKAAITYTGGGTYAAGAYSAYANFPVGVNRVFNNYSVDEASRISGYFTISPKTIKGSYSSAEKEMTYMGTEIKPTFVYSGVLPGDSMEIIHTGAGENVGTYTISASSGNSNYKIECEPFTYKINPAPVAIVWGSAALTYNGQVHSPKATTDSTIYSRDDIEIVCTYNKTDAERKNVGPFIATATLASKISSRPASNYEIVSGKTKEFFVNHVQLEISVKNVNLIYNGAAQSPVAEIVNKSAIVAGDDLELVVTGSATEAGTYTATVELKNNNSEPAKNYKLKYEDQFNMEITVTFYITAPSEPETRSVDLAESGKRYYNDAETAEGGSL